MELELLTAVSNTNCVKSGRVSVLSLCVSCVGCVNLFIVIPNYRNIYNFR